MKYLILVSMLCFTLGCSSSIHIRKDAYYPYDWGISGMAAGTYSETQKHHPIFTESGKLSDEGSPNFKKTMNYFVFGLFPGQPVVKLSEVCGDKPFRQAFLSHNFGQAWISFLTLGIYTPMDFKVWCGDINEKN